jgi:hypothetical protein
VASFGALAGFNSRFDPMLKDHAIGPRVPASTLLPRALANATQILTNGSDREVYRLICVEASEQAF